MTSNLSTAETASPQASTPRVSFITTCKHRLHHLQQTLPRMVAAEPDEIIVVDYACPQQAGSWVAENYPQANVVHVDDDPNFNVSRARNLGAAQASGDWLVFIDADILVDPTWVAWQREHLNPHCFHRAAPVMGQRDKETSGTCICPRDWFDRIGGYDEAFRGWGGEDRDLYSRLVAVGVVESTYPSSFVTPIRHNDDDRMRYCDIKKKGVRMVIHDLYITAKHQAMQAMAPGRRPLKQPALAERQKMMSIVRKTVATWLADPSQPMAPIEFQVEGQGLQRGTHRLRLSVKCEVSMVPADAETETDTKR